MQRSKYAFLATFFPTPLKVVGFHKLRLWAPVLCIRAGPEIFWSVRIRMLNICIGFGSDLFDKKVCYLAIIQLTGLMCRIRHNMKSKTGFGSGLHHSGSTTLALSTIVVDPVLLAELGCFTRKNRTLPLELLNLWFVRFSTKIHKKLQKWITLTETGKHNDNLTDPSFVSDPDPVPNRSGTPLFSGAQYTGSTIPESTMGIAATDLDHVLLRDDLGWSRLTLKCRIIHEHEYTDGKHTKNLTEPSLCRIRIWIQNGF